MKLKPHYIWKSRKDSVELISSISENNLSLYVRLYEGL
jgi:hypothetical protein